MALEIDWTPHPPAAAHPASLLLLGALATTRLVVGPAHRGTLELDAVQPLEHSVEDGVGDGRIPEGGMPIGDRQLAREYRRPPTRAMARSSNMSGARM